jgi:di/tricarboxylate transporter
LRRLWFFLPARGMLPCNQYFMTTARRWCCRRLTIELNCTCQQSIVAMLAVLLLSASFLVLSTVQQLRKRQSYECTLSTEAAAVRQKRHQQHLRQKYYVFLSATSVAAVGGRSCRESLVATAATAAAVSAAASAVSAAVPAAVKASQLRIQVFR